GAAARSRWLSAHRLRVTGHPVCTLLQGRIVGTLLVGLRAATRNRQCADGRGRVTDVSCLAVEDLTIAFGGVRVLDAVNFSIASGELVGLVGPNGSGKTTLVNILSGYLRPDAGEVRLEGRRIDGLRPSALAHLGVLRTFQLTRV